MTFSDTERILNRIRIHRPKLDKLMETISRNNNYKSEWYKVLKSYDYEDISDSLDNWLKQESHDGFIPNVYELTRNCYTIEEKNRPTDFKCSCNYCGKFITFRDFDKHEKRCRSINYVFRTNKKYFNREIDKEELQKLNEEEFDDIYYKYLELLEKKVPIFSQEHEFIKKVLETKI